MMPVEKIIRLVTHRIAVVAVCRRLLFLSAIKTFFSDNFFVALGKCNPTTLPFIVLFFLVYYGVTFVGTFLFLPLILPASIRSHTMN